jgi:hypothetical protein
MVSSQTGAFFGAENPTIENPKAQTTQRPGESGRTDEPIPGQRATNHRSEGLFKENLRSTGKVPRKDRMCKILEDGLRPTFEVLDWHSVTLRWKEPTLDR